MFVSIDNALSHIESQILPCTNLGIGRDDLLKRICDAAGEYFRCSDQDEQYQFVSIQTLKKLKQVQHSQINGADHNSTRQACHLLIGFITNQPTKGIPKELLCAGHLFIEDADDFITLMCLEAKPTSLEKLVVIPQWTFIPRCNQKNDPLPYIEVNNCLLEVLPYPRKAGSPSLLSSSFDKSRSSKREVTLAGRVAYLSPVHKFSGSDPFFLAKLDSIAQPVVVMGEEYMYWWNCLRPGLFAKFVDVKYSKLNKGSSEEKDIIKVSSKSRLEIPDLNGRVSDKGNIEKRNDGLISYTGTITCCSLAKRGVFELDHRLRLILSHQPSQSNCIGLRNGAKICVYNAHLLVFEKIPFLVCCTSSTVKVTEFSSSSATYQPFIALQNVFTRNCQEIRMKDFLYWLQVSDDLSSRFPFLRESKSATLSKALLNNYLTFQPVKRNTVSEFFSQPHQCIVTSKNPAPSPKIPSLLTIKDTVDEKFIRSSEPSIWRRGDELDRLSAQCDAATCAWGYKLVSSSEVGNLIAVALLDLRSSSGKIQLKDSTGSIDVEFIPSKFTSESQRNQIYKSLLMQASSETKPVICLRNFYLVLERLRDSQSQLFDYNLYILADLQRDENTLYLYTNVVASKKGDKKRQISSSDGGRCGSKRMKCDKSDSCVSDKRDTAWSQSTCAVLTDSTATKAVTRSFGVTDNEASRLLISNENEAAKKTPSTGFNEGSESESHSRGIISGGKTKPPKSPQDSRKDGLAGVDGIANRGSCLASHRGQAKSDRLEVGNASLQVNEGKPTPCFDLFLAFIRKVAVLQKVANAEGKSYVAIVTGTLVGKLHPLDGSTAPENFSVRRNANTNEREVLTFSEGSKLCFESTGEKEFTVNLDIDEEYRSIYSSILWGNFHMLKSTLDLSNGNASKYALRLGLDILVYLAELKKDLLVINGHGEAAMSRNCSKAIQRVLKSNQKNCRKTMSVRSALKFGSVSCDSTGSFSGVITSRNVKSSTLWGTKNRSHSIVLRLRDFNWIDEISVYVCLNRFVLPNGCLPGARLHFKDVCIKASLAGKGYCSVAAATEIRVMSFDESDLGCVDVSAPTKSAAEEGEYRRTLTWLLKNEKDAINLAWQVKLDFVAVRWATIYWRCRICKQKLIQLICTRGCPQDLKFIAQMSTIVDDGTTQAYLQAEQETLSTFLAIPGTEWEKVLQTAKFEEISYQRDMELDSRQNLPLNRDVKSKFSRRKQVEQMLRALFCKISQRPSHIVDCKLFNQGSKQGKKDTIRTIKLGSEEYLTRAPNRLNLQAIRIHAVDYSFEALNLIEELHKRKDTHAYETEKRMETGC